jgi:hypothetical protein
MNEIVCENTRCHSCDRFEEHIESVESVPMLRGIRRNVMARQRPEPGTWIEEWSCWIANKVIFTGGFFIVCNLVAFTPLVFETDLVFKIVNWVSSNWWQLVLLPLIGIATKRQDKLNEFNNQRQYRILLISERIDELREGGVE